MWRITGNEVSVNRHRLINLVKTIYLSVQRFLADDLQSKAAALTFSTLLAVVPALALVFAVAKGFGFQAIVQSQLFDYFPAQREALEQAMTFVDSYLSHTKDGIFVGVGIILIWSVVSLLNSVEQNVQRHLASYQAAVDIPQNRRLHRHHGIAAGADDCGRRFIKIVTSGIDTRPMLAFRKNSGAACGAGGESLSAYLHRLYGVVYAGA